MTRYDNEVLAFLRKEHDEGRARSWFKKELSEAVGLGVCNTYKALMSLLERGFVQRERVDWPGNPGYAYKWSLW